MFQYYDLSPDEFEHLVIAICKEILGIATQGFAKGIDGGRDAKFIGTTNLYPSQTDPWTGTTIIQAKHTNGINKHFGEPDFHKILVDEIPKIKKLIANKELDNYMLFANRQLTANIAAKLINEISQETGLTEDKVKILGIEELNYYLDRYKYICDLSQVNLQPLTKSPILKPEQLASVIEYFATTFNSSYTKIKDDISRTTYEEKNVLNNTSPDFAKSLRKNYMKYVAQVKEFLEDPQNERILEQYQNAVEEFQFNFILPRQKNLDYFDNVFNELVNILVDRNYLLRTNVKLTRILVFYMYWNCDIGKSND